MKLLAVRQARFLAFFNSEELNPSGRVLVPDYMNGFIQRYNFLKYPQKIEDIIDAENKGIAFEVGKWNDIAIDKVTMFSWGVVVDTISSTDHSEGMLQDALAWGAETFGLSNRPDLISRKGYVSELVFTSDLFLPAINPKLESLADGITKTISKNFRQTLNYGISAIHFHFDTNLSKQFFAPLKIERHEDAPYFENKYYSGAPLPTEEHIKFIEDFEAALKS